MIEVHCTIDPALCCQGEDHEEVFVPAVRPVVAPGEVQLRFNNGRTENVST